VRGSFYHALEETEPLTLTLSPEYEGEGTKMASALE
jgi:hypothetical protein